MLKDQASTWATRIVYVRLLDEGVVVGRPTEAIATAGAVNEFLLLPTSDYDAADEHWELLAGSTVECVFQKSHDGKIILVAQKLLKKPERSAVTRAPHPDGKIMLVAQKLLKKPKEAP